MEKRQKRDVKSGNDLIFGTHPITEAIKAGKTFDKLFIQKSFGGDMDQDLFQAIQEYKVPYVKVPVEKLNRITGKNHQGVVGFISPIEFSSLDNVINSVFANGANPFILVLDKITDVRNFGAIVRSAECAGVNAVVVPVRGAAQISSDAMKTSAGALNHVPICRATDLLETVSYLKESGLAILASTEKTNELIYNQDLNRPLAVIMGSEEDGISQDILKLADARVKIPINGKISSLNVSTAAGIIMYETVRQRL